MDFTSLLVGVPILFALLCEAGYRGSQGSGFVNAPKVASLPLLVNKD